MKEAANQGLVGQIHEFVDRCLQDLSIDALQKLLPFDASGDKVKVNNADTACSIGLVEASKAVLIHQRRVSLEVELFYDACACTERIELLSSGARNHHDATSEQATVFNNLIWMIRSALDRNSEYKARFNQRHKTRSILLHDYRRFIDEIFDRHSKVAVVRLDLGYAGSSPTSKDIKRLCKARRKFLKAQYKSPALQNLITYIWRMEYGQDRGFHLHLLLFFNGQHVCKDVFYGLRLCELWRSMVGGGAWANTTSTAEKNMWESQGRCGVGMIDYRDQPKRRNLDFILQYLMKTEQMLPFTYGVKFRSLGHGNLITTKVASGRPRML